MSTVVVVTSTAVAVAVSVGAKVIMNKRDRKKYIEALNGETVKFSQTERDKIVETRLIMKEVFGDNPAEAMRNAASVEKLEMMKSFVKRTADAYELDLKVSLTNGSLNRLGYYDWENNRAQFNVTWLLYDGAEYSQAFDEIVLSLIHTVIHELRHAVQHKAIKEKGFWGIEDARVEAWEYNFRHYILSSVNFKAYGNQPVEIDANAFANETLRGVYDYVYDKLY